LVLELPPVLVLLMSTVPASMFLMMIAIQEFKLNTPMTPARKHSAKQQHSSHITRVHDCDVPCACCQHVGWVSGIRLLQPRIRSREKLLWLHPLCTAGLPNL
jgi:hypothetical protein